MKPIIHTDLYEAAMDALELSGRLWDRFAQLEYFTHRRGTNMTKDELAIRVQVQTGIQQKQAKEAINTILEGIQEALTKGDRVELRGFGSFNPVERAARPGRNPNTGEAFEIPARCDVKFKAGKAFKEKLQQIEK